MDEHALRELIGEVKAGRLSRRAWLRMMIGLGVTAPMAAQMLASTASRAQPKAPGFTPTRRGGGGNTLGRLSLDRRVLAPTGLNTAP